MLQRPVTVLTLQKTILSNLLKSQQKHVPTKENKKTYSPLLLEEALVQQYNFIKCRLCTENLMNS